VTVSSYAPTAPLAQGLYDPANEHDACGIGFVAHLRGEKSYGVIHRGLEMLLNLTHRAATGPDGEVGDGAGILLQLPHALLRTACRGLDIPLPDAGGYGVGMLFLPRDDEGRAAATARIEAAVAAHGCRVLGWRLVPVDDTQIAERVRDSRPAIWQVFVAPSTLDRLDDDGSGFERTLYVIRRSIEREANALAAAGGPTMYVTSFSSRTIVYKGLLRPDQIPAFYRDLSNPEAASALALVHSRFSTNTFPSWPLAHPYRFVCHNGEINTMKGNLAWMRARERSMLSPRFADTMSEVLPVIMPGGNDSASLDNVVELLVHAGRPLAHAMMMLVPEAWERDASMPPERRAFYDYHSSLMEPWDGPAAIAFTDGRQIGAIQDRNGLRPARWIVTDDDIVVLSSEAGAMPVDAECVREKGRLRPGQLLLVNTTQGRLLHDDEIKSELVSLRPYRRWVSEQRIELSSLVASADQSVLPATLDDDALLSAQRKFGYTREELSMIITPMASAGEEALGSMGSDTPLAVLSDHPQLLFSYFRQLFAQVTNPPIDPIREALVMSVRMRLGAQGNLLDETPEHAKQIDLEHPVLRPAGVAVLRAIQEPSLKPVTLSAHFSPDVENGLELAVEALCDSALQAVRDGRGTIILSDRDPAVGQQPMPSLLAVAAVHHRLIREGCRSSVSLVVEAADAREVSHIALLFSYGAAAVSPYLALESCAAMARSGALGESIDEATAQANYVYAVEKGLLKILSKMGVSTLQSYCGAQLWEAVGLSSPVIDRYFTGTSSKLGGIDLGIIAEEVVRRANAERGDALLDVGGEYHYRAKGERHAWNPGTIATLQRATREGDYGTFREFSRLANEEQRGAATLRAMLDFVEGDSVPLDQVEPAASIVRRFVSGAMSFGSISAEAHETLAVAMNQIGGRSNTGEGGEDPARFGTSRNSAIKQVASARFGVTTEYLVSADELQIKVAQGAKPGEGGQLPGHKIDEFIGKTRHATPGVTLISPPPHHDIYSIEDLKQLIFDLRNVNPAAAISVKLVAEAGVGTVAAGVAKAGADLITISGDSGGTGASPLSSIKRAGVAWELGLAETQQTLVLNGLRANVRVQVDGQLKTGRDVVLAALLGAEEFGFATAPLIVEGCIMMRKCHLNTCPVGIATQDPVLRAKFAGRPEHLVNYFFFVAEEVRELMAQLGFRSLDEMVGRTDRLRVATHAPHWKASTLDLKPLLHASALLSEGSARCGTQVAEYDLSKTLDGQLLPVVANAIERGEAVTVSRAIRNVDRAVGALISGEIARKYGSAGLPQDTITVRFNGSAGQSFGAFATQGLTLELEGESNDYVGKGLSGGRLIVHPPKTTRLLQEGTVIVGNTVLYGATSGEAFIAGAAGERFAVRNSGAMAVVEGVGDHGCEYMTGGTVVVLGTTGRNFAAGMSGGVAFVLDVNETFRTRVTSPLVELTPVTEAADQAALRRWIERHAAYTGSRRARHALAHWNETLRHFVRVMPIEYKRALERKTRTTPTSVEVRHG
jgi:glutamate synthase domain-containing protein 2/glutamate synthase domain-containing protein 1/glutamate synthase domain-containing protein 3